MEKYPKRVEVMDNDSGDDWTDELRLDNSVEKSENDQD